MTRPKTHSDGPTNQLTIRGYDEELRERLERLARERGISLNKAALVLMRRGAGLDDAAARAADVVGSSLDEFVGSWSREEERQFLESVAPLDRIDESLWR